MNGANILAIGVGGGGGNALSSMVRLGMPGIHTVAANTDKQALDKTAAAEKLLLGSGLGAGGIPEEGRKAAIESQTAIIQTVQGADLVFVTAGMGGGTGTGAAPVVAEIARRTGALTIGVVTRPFPFEGGKRKRQAEAGLERLLASVDALIVVSNARLLEVCGDDVTMLDAFEKADRVLFDAVQGVAGLVQDVGYINIDFADLQSVMRHTGLALMGAGRAEGEGRVLKAVQAAASSPLLDGVQLDGAHGILVNFRAAQQLTLKEVNAAMSWLHGQAHEEAEIVFGAIIDETMGDAVAVTLVATGFEEAREAEPEPVPVPARRASSPPASSLTPVPTTRRESDPPRLQIRPPLGTGGVFDSDRLPSYPHPGDHRPKRHD
jgi:cell division protein FtsZ